VDYFENPVYPLEDSYDYRISKSGHQCEIPDNDYYESRTYPTPVGTPIPTPSGTQTPIPYFALWDYRALTDEEDDSFDESDRSQYPEGVGRIFRTGKTIEKADEIYFSHANSVVFRNEDFETVAIITKNGSLFLKGNLITSEDILKNDIEELPPVVNKSLTSVYFIDLPGENNDIAYDGPNDWLLEPLSQVTPSPAVSLEENSNHKEWIIKNSSGDIVAILDYVTGDLNIQGELKVWDDTVLYNSSIRKFIVRSSSSINSAVFMIDESGNLYMKGALFHKCL
jgi:hypothetical protein